MKTRIGACLVVAITVLACLFIYASSDHKEERTSGSTVANIPTRSPSVENDENLSTDIAENAGTNVVAANSPAPAAMVHNDDSSPGIADEKWDTDVARPSRDKLTVFVLNKLIADGAKDFLDNFSMFIVPSRPDHAPEINLYLDTSVVEFQNEDCIEVLESLMWFVHEYLVENKMDVSEIQINGILQFDHETAGWGYLYDGVFDWTANDTPPAEAQTQVEVQAPPQRMETEETQITVSAESGARIISQPDSMGFFQYEKLCAGCNRPKFSGSAIKRRGATFGPFSDNSEMCTNCKTWNSARFRGY